MRSISKRTIGISWTTFVIIFIFIVPLSAQITFERWYGGTGGEIGWHVDKTPDGGYIIAGETTSFGAGDYDAWFIKTDSLGDTLWTKTYGGTGYDFIFSVAQTSDSNYIIVGGTTSFGAGSKDIWLIKTDSIGDTLWTKTYGGSNDDRGFSVIQTSDSGYIIAGWTKSFGAGDHDVWVLKTDASGDTLWTKTYGGIGMDIGYSIILASDQGYIITGRTRSFGAGSDDVYLIKINESGDTLWTKSYGGASSDVGFSAAQTLDGGYIIGATANSFGAGMQDVYLIKTDSLGDTLWTRTYGGYSIDSGYWAIPTSDSGYIIVGRTYSFGPGAPGYASVYLIKTDSLGDTLWTRTYGGTYSDQGESVAQTSDGGYIIVGKTSSFGAGGNDIYIIKTNASGYVGIEESGLHPAQNAFCLLQNYPNPFNFYTSFRYVLPRNTYVKLDIYNIQGQLVKKLVNERQKAGTQIIYWNSKDEKGKNVSSGIYFCRLTTDAFVAIKKCIILK